MAIQQRRGNEADFVAGKMLPAELAVSLDANIIRVCFGSGRVKELALKEYVETGLSTLEDDIEAELAGISRDLAATGTAVTNLSGRMGAAEQALNNHNARITTLESKEAEDRARVGSLEAAQQAQGATVAGIRSRLDTVDATASGAAELAGSNERRIGALEPSLATARQDISNLGRNVTANTQAITALQGRVASAEQGIDDILSKDVVWSFAVNSAGHLIETVERYDIDEVTFQLQEGRMMVTYG